MRYLVIFKNSLNEFWDFCNSTNTGVGSPNWAKGQVPLFFSSFFLVGVCVHGAKKWVFALLIVKLWDLSHVKGKKNLVKLSI
jgi:hypothetical protein